MENYNNGYTQKTGFAKKLLEGILISFEIMGLFTCLQVMVSMAAMTGAAAAYMMNTGCSLQYAMNQSAGLVSSEDFMIGLTVGATAVSAAFSVSFYWIIWGRKKTAQDKQYLREKMFQAKPILMISILTIGCYYMAMLIAELIAVISPETMENYNELMEMTLGGNELLAMLAAVILAPVNEECIMRGLILGNLRKYFPVPAAVAIQAVMFGIFHMNWVQGFYVLPIGAALGYVAVKSRSVLPCIYMHLFYNLMSFVLGILPGIFQSVGFSVAAVAVCLTAICLMGRESYGKNKNS